MTYRFKYSTPVGFDDILMFSDGSVLTELRFEQTHKKPVQKELYEEKNLPVFDDVSHWLSIYFSGKEPDFTPDYRIDGMTPFRKDVFEILLKIPFGKTVTTAKSRQKSQKNAASQKCLRRQSAAQSAGTLSASSCLATASSEQTAGLPVMAAGSKIKLHCLSWKKRNKSLPVNYENLRDGLECESLKMYAYA